MHKIYIYMSPSTGYSAFELRYLHKPADLTHIKYGPVQCLARSLHDYMKSMKKKFSIMKKIALDKRTHDQSLH